MARSEQEPLDWAEALEWVAFRDGCKVDFSLCYRNWAKTDRTLDKVGTQFVEAYFDKAIRNAKRDGNERITKKLVDPNCADNLRSALMRGKIHAKIYRSPDSQLEDAPSVEWRKEPAQHFYQVFLPIKEVIRAFPGPQMPPIGELVRAPGLLERAGERLGREGTKTEVAQRVARIIYREKGFLLDVKQVLNAWKDKQSNERLTPYLSTNALDLQDDGKKGAKEATITKQAKKKALTR